MKTRGYILTAVSFLLASCLSLDTLSPEKELLRAAADGNTATLTRVCRQGVNLNTQSADGETALGLALERFRKGGSLTDSDSEAPSPGWENIETLLQAGANPNTPHRHTTPLHLAVSSGNPHIVSLLLQYGANPNAETRSCLAPLWQTVYCNNFIIANILLQAGANPHARDAHGLTPVQYLRQTGQDSGSLYRLLL